MLYLFQEIDYKKLYLPKNVSLYDSTQIMDSNPIKTAIVVCNKLIREQVRTLTRLIRTKIGIYFWAMFNWLRSVRSRSSQSENTNCIHQFSDWMFQVYAIIVSKPENGELSPASVSYTAGFYHIPVIGISSRDSAFSDKVINTISN